MAFIHSSDNARGASSDLEKKSPLAFRSSGEVATELGVAQHVLRYWESKFSQIRTTQRGNGGRRRYRPEEVDLLRRIRSLLYDNCYTIKGVQRLLKEGGGHSAARDAGSGETACPMPIGAADVRSALMRFRPQPATNVTVLHPAGGLDGGKRREIENVLEDLQNVLELLRGAIHGQHYDDPRYPRIQEERPVRSAAAADERGSTAARRKQDSRLGSQPTAPKDATSRRCLTSSNSMQK